MIVWTHATHPARFRKKRRCSVGRVREWVRSSDLKVGQCPGLTSCWIYGSLRFGRISSLSSEIKSGARRPETGRKRLETRPEETHIPGRDEIGLEVWKEVSKPASHDPSLAGGLRFWRQTAGIV